MATIALDGAAWEARGAHFFDADDPIGGVTRIASGEVRDTPHADGRPGLQFGVLDHGESTTYLVAAADDADDVLAAMVSAGIPPEALLERLPAAPERSLDERMADMEQALAEMRAAMPSGRLVTSAHPQIVQFNRFDPAVIEGLAVLDLVHGAPLDAEEVATPPDAPNVAGIYTYRGRSLEELVPRIRQELGDDAVIVHRRETTSGGVGGFFAKHEIEVEVQAQPPAGGAKFRDAGIVGDVAHMVERARVRADRSGSS